MKSFRSARPAEADAEAQVAALAQRMAPVHQALIEAQARRAELDPTNEKRIANLVQAAKKRQAGTFIHHSHAADPDPSPTTNTTFFLRISSIAVVMTAFIIVAAIHGTDIVEVVTGVQLALYSIVDVTRHVLERSTQHRTDRKDVSS
ncbi:hypothetical protein [Catenulispora subtropica]|uniref:Uncharacterized protein n=1 Tax=Catenulispora subtropica TaxID=450798 RepID=A0ABP5CG14_9ACTN